LEVFQDASSCQRLDSVLAIDADEAARLYGVFKEEKGWLNALRVG
jgi:hypothetical protein